MKESREGEKYINIYLQAPLVAKIELNEMQIQIKVEKYKRPEEVGTLKSLNSEYFCHLEFT